MRQLREANISLDSRDGILQGQHHAVEQNGENDEDSEVLADWEVHGGTTDLELLRSLAEYVRCEPHQVPGREQEEGICSREPMENKWWRDHTERLQDYYPEMMIDIIYNTGGPQKKLDFIEVFLGAKGTKNLVSSLNQDSKEQESKRKTQICLSTIIDNPSFF